MYRALIVEDEPPILRKITSSLRAMSDAFDIEVAHDGQEAFEYLMNHPVDVVFTDIRMPIMDGLALSDKIRKLYPEICILIITGYYDYSYAKSAIQTGVFDYILKPLSSVEFRATIQRVEQHLDKQRSQRILQSLTNIASGQPNDDAEVFQNAGYQYLSAFLIVRNGYPYRFDESSTCEQIGEDEKGLLLEEIRGNEYLSAGKTVTFARDGYYQREIIILVLHTAEMRAGHGLLEGLLQRLQAACHGAVYHVGMETWSAGVANHAERVAGLRKRFEQAIIFGKSTLYVEEGTVHSGEPRNAPHIDAKEWKTEDDLRASVLRMMDWGKNNWITRFELQDLLDYVLESMEPPGGYDGRRTAKNRLDQLVSKCEGYPQLTHEVTALFRGMWKTQKHIGEPVNLDGREAVESIRVYIDTHYAEELTVQNLAERFGFNPSYLGQLFRKHTHLSLNQYIIQKRISVAANLIRNDASLTVKDIAMAVGYDDPLYFSRIFKRHTGFAPTELREKE